MSGFRDSVNPRIINEKKQTKSKLGIKCNISIGLLLNRNAVMYIGWPWFVVVGVFMVSFVACSGQTHISNVTMPCTYIHNQKSHKNQQLVELFHVVSSQSILFHSYNSRETSIEDVEFVC